MAEPAPLNWSTLFMAWDMPISGAVLVAFATVLYLWGVRRLGRASHLSTDGGAWPLRYSAAYLGGLLITLLALGSSINAYSDVLFSMHMAQHLLLIMVAPTLIILGRPVELLQRVTSADGDTGAALRRFARGRFVTAVTHPFFGFVYYTVVVVGTHLTPFQQYALTITWVHGLEEVLYLTSGYLLLLPVLGVEPIRNSMPYLLRIVTLMGGMVVDTIVGVMLMMTPYVRFPAYAEVARDWGPSALEDQTWGGATMWIGGDGLMVLLAVIVISRWMNSSSGSTDVGPWLESARRSALAGTDPEAPRNLGASDDIDDDEEALRAYNAMLARLAESERGRHRGR